MYNKKNFFIFDVKWNSNFQDGTIGEDLVVRPLPVSLHSLVKEAPKEEEVNENDLPPDDQLFMDTDGDMLINDGYPLSPDELAVSDGFGGDFQMGLVGSCYFIGCDSHVNNSSNTFPNSYILNKKLIFFQ